MHRLLVLALACTLLAACSPRALRQSDDLWDGYASADGATFLGYHGRVERTGDSPRD